MSGGMRRKATSWPETGLTLPEKGETYFALWVISNFLTTFLMEAP